MIAIRTHQSSTPNAPGAASHRLLAPRPRFQLVGTARLRRYVVAAVIGVGITGTAHAAPFGSAGWYNNNGGSRGAPAGASSGAGTAQNPNGAARIPGARSINPQEAAARTAETMRNLSRAADALAGMRNAQVMAHQMAAQQQTELPDGLQEGGLQVADNVPANLDAPGEGENAKLWQNIDLPTEVNRDGQTVVTVKQTGENAVATWKTFNVSRDTRVHFDQTDGALTNGDNNWAVLNRIVDPQARPSRINGQIDAEGTVYLLNRNGILFGGASQVNVQNLVAATLDFAGGNPADNLDDQAQRFISGDATYEGSDGSGDFTNRLVIDSEGDLSAAEAITVERGARIEADDGGDIFMAAPRIVNGGQLTARRGRVSLASVGGGNFGDKLAGGGSSAAYSENATAGQTGLTGGLGPDPRGLLKGVRVDNQITGESQSVFRAEDDFTENQAAQYETINARGQTLNRGLIDTPLGSSRLYSNFGVVQAGVVSATTSTNSAGDIRLISRDTVTTSPDSVTTVLPEDDGSTVQTDLNADNSFEPSTVALQGNLIRMDGGALIEAPGANLSFAGTATTDAVSRISLAAGAVVDVSGLPNVQRDVGDNSINIPRVGLNELANSPVSRSRGDELYGREVYFDRRRFGTRNDGVDWVGSPLLNAEGYLSQVPRDIQQLMINGGSITLTGENLFARSGSNLRLQGGYIHYNAGQVHETRLIGPQGAVPLSQAGRQANYTGIAGITDIVHSRWNITDSYRHPLLFGGANTFSESSYIDGGNAGVLAIAMVKKTALNSDIDADALTGRYQLLGGAPADYGFASLNGPLSALGERTGDNNYADFEIYRHKPRSGTFYISNDTGLGAIGQRLDYSMDTVDGLQLGSNSLPVGEPIIVQKNRQPIPQALTPGSAYTPAEPGQRRTYLSSDQLNAAGFGRISLAREGRGVRIARNAPLRVAPGGQIDITGVGRVDVLSDLTARAGDISVTARGVLRDFGGSGDLLFNGIDPTGENDDGRAAFRAPFEAVGAADTGVAVGSQVALDASGLWVNDANQPLDRQMGDGFIDGGSVRLTNLSEQFNRSGEFNPEYQPVFAGRGLALPDSAVIDVSSGGYVTPAGVIARDNAIPRGRAGSVALEAFKLGIGGAITTTNIYGEVLDNINSLFADGDADAGDFGTLAYNPETIRAKGFAGGGTLALQAAAWHLGEGGADTPALVSTLTADQLSGNSFERLSIRSATQLEVAGGTRLAPRPTFWTVDDPVTAARAPTGRAVDDIAGVSPGTVPLARRAPQSLDLEAGRWPTLDERSAITDRVLATAGLTVANGAVIDLEAGAEARLVGHAGAYVDGKITAPGGSISVLGSRSKLGEGNNQANPNNQFTTVEVGGNARLDVSGTTVRDPFAVAFDRADAAPNQGRVLAGGVLRIDNATGAVAVADGARLAADGHVDTLNIRADNLAGYRTARLWSDGGTLRLRAAQNLYMAGDLSARGGAEAARDGTLQIATDRPVENTGFASFDDEGATTILLTRQAVDVPDAEPAPEETSTGGTDNPDDGATPFTILALNDRVDRATDGQGVLRIASDTISRSGVSSVALGEGVRFDTYRSLDLAVVGDNRLSLGKALVLEGIGRIRALAPEALESDATLADAATGSSRLTVDAPYISWSNIGEVEAAADVAPTGQLVFNAGRQIDLGGQIVLDGVANAAFTSAGPLRLITRSPQTAASLDVGGTNVAAGRVERFEKFPGSLVTRGDIDIAASQVYPSTEERFAIRAVGATDADSGERAPTTVRFTRTTDTRPNVPLSAGGALGVEASHIVQNGVLRAPSGRLSLGVNTPADPAAAVFDSQATVQTQSLAFGPDSYTSVSLEGATVPWGYTVDATDYRYGVFGGSDARSVNLNADAPPAKRLALRAGDIDLGEGAVLDTRGGGDLLAQEWIPGTGGTRDVLSRYQQIYGLEVALAPDALNPEFGAAVPTYPDARPIYALVPEGTGIAPFDPALIPRTGALDFYDPSRIGETIELSAAEGIPGGRYTLAPPKYAVLPNTLRVVGVPGSIDALASANAVKPDGTRLVAGRFVSRLNEARDARAQRFVVQTRSAWRRYSEYALTSANAYFGNAQDGQPPRLPLDAGRTVLAARNSLGLAGETRFGAPADGRGGTVDIAGERIAIGNAAGGGEGVLNLAVADLNNLNAASLLIGATRAPADDNAGQRLDVTARQITVATSADNPLVAPDLILAANAGDAPESDGIQIQDGSVIRGQAGGSAAPVEPLLVGRDAEGDAARVNGDGALLRVAANGQAAVRRAGLVDPVGQLRIRANTQITSDGGLTLDGAGTVTAAPSAVLSARQVSLSSGRITVDANDDASLSAGAEAGLVIGPATLARFADADDVALQSYDVFDFGAGLTLASDNNLELSARRFVADGDVALSANTLALGNRAGGTAATAGPDTAGTAVLSLTADGLILGIGEGTARFDGFGQLAAAADTAVITRGAATLDAGAADIDIVTPIVQADAGSQAGVTTTGAVRLARPMPADDADDSAAPASDDADMAGVNDTPLPSAGFDIAPLGGSLAITGNNVSVQTPLRANSGTLALTATGGNLTINQASVLDAGGAAQDFFDLTRYSSGGSIDLTANRGDITLGENSRLNAAAPEGGGDGGSLGLSVGANGALDLAGSLAAGAGSQSARGGSLSLTSGGAIDLGFWAGFLDGAGVTRELAFTSGQGDLTLAGDQALTAERIELVANGGQPGNALGQGGWVNVDGTLDARGPTGGTIHAFGRGGVAINGTLNATGGENRGGRIVIGTRGTPNGQVNPGYGYQQITAANSGRLRLGDNARIRLAGNNGARGGNLTLRAPLLASGDVNVAIADPAGITGADRVDLEAYATWATTDASTGAQHFDGLIDPAGFFNADGSRVAGVFINVDNGFPVSGEPDLARGDFFFPDEGAVNADHVGFFTDTLAGFVQSPGFAFEQRFADVENFHARPGIVLRNPDANRLGGDVRVVTPWNLGAGTLQNGDIASRLYRYGDQAPVVSIAARNDVEVNASITDGFFQFYDDNGLSDTVPFIPVGVVPNVMSVADYSDAIDSDYFARSFTAELLESDTPNAVVTASDVDNINRYIDAYTRATLIGDFDDPVSLSVAASRFLDLGDGLSLDVTTRSVPGVVERAPQRASFDSYADYIAAYNDYKDTAYRNFSQFTFSADIVPKVAMPVPPDVPMIDSRAVGGRFPVTAQRTANSPSPLARYGDPVPQQTMLPVPGESSDYRLVAGADAASADPTQTRLDHPGALSVSGARGFTTDDKGFDDGNPGFPFTLISPTLIRTGTGHIDLAAGGDIALTNEQRPASIFSAGEGEFRTSRFSRTKEVEPYVTNPSTPEFEGFDSLASTLGNSRGVNVSAGGDVRAAGANQALLDRWVRMPDNRLDLAALGETLNPLSVELPNIIAVGGDVRARAGGDIDTIRSAAYPRRRASEAESADESQATNVFNGALNVANLDVQARGNILGGTFFAGSGIADIQAGGRIGASQGTAPIAFAGGTADYRLRANGDLRLSTLYPGFDDKPYASSRLSLTSTGGDIALGRSQADTLSRTYFTVPAGLSISAFSGDVFLPVPLFLAPGADNDFQIVADGQLAIFTVKQADTLDRLNNNSAPLDDTSELGTHIDDDAINHVYARSGDVVGLARNDDQISSQYRNSRGVVAGATQTRVQADRDVKNLEVYANHYRPSDLTRVVAGRDITGSAAQILRGTLQISAGRDISIPVNKIEQGTVGFQAGSQTIKANAEGLTGEGNLNIQYGVAPGRALDAFAERYIRPGAGVSGIPAATDRLVDFVATYQASLAQRAGEPTPEPPTAEAAWETFQGLPDYRKALLVDTVYTDVLNQVGLEYNQPGSPYNGSYSRGYEAVNTLFPAGLGYTANNLSGGPAGATELVQTGNFDMRNNLVYAAGRGVPPDNTTAAGRGALHVIGPGGGLNVGSVAAPPTTFTRRLEPFIAPFKRGLFNYGNGDLGIMTDNSIQLAQSRVFSVYGGDLIMWSSNGDINAGKGAKTTGLSGGQISGAGIAALQLDPAEQPGTANLMAPRGTVDAGEAGIRVNGVLNVAAFAVANADNIQVSGQTIGVPTGLVNVGALSTANAANAAAQQAAADVAANAAQTRKAATLINVEIVGFGRPDAGQQDAMNRYQNGG